MRVYHGSYTEINDIDLSKCEPKRDFGRGFYVTKFREQAEIWAVRKGNWKHTNSVVTEFEFDEEEANYNSTINVLQFDDYNEDWFDFVVKNRNSRITNHDYDIIEGPVADDKIQNRIQMFIDGEITKEDFFSDLKHPEPSHQICFCTINSLKTLKKLGRKIIYKIEDIAEKIVERLIIDFGKSEKEASEIFFASSTFAQLSDKTTQLYEKDWTEIYELLSDELNI